MEEERLLQRQLAIMEGIPDPGRLGYNDSYKRFDDSPSEFGFHFHRDVDVASFPRYSMDCSKCEEFRTYSKASNQNVPAFTTTQLICSTAIVVAMRTGLMASIIGRTAEQVFHWPSRRWSTFSTSLNSTGSRL